MLGAEVRLNAYICQGFYFKDNLVTSTMHNIQASVFKSRSPYFYFLS